jgi:predicted nucleotide-binding protein (sugar kinase/HSP70/actin superfamily)
LISIISSFKKVNVVIDALDECREHIRKDMITAIKNIHKPNIAHVLVTSRPFPHILSQFEDSIHLEIRASDADLSAYLRMQLSHASKAVQVFTDDIVTTIIKKVKGM